MFGKKTNKTVEIEKAPTSFANPAANAVIAKPVVKENKLRSGATTIISKDAEVLGDIIFIGSLEIEGQVKGNIRSKEAEATVRVLEDGRVEGDIVVARANLNGEIKGNVQAKTVELAAKARVDGNVYYEVLEMTKGAQVNGNLVHGEKPKSPEPNKKAQQGQIQPSLT